jgi:retinol dehydrogenase 12
VFFLQGHDLELGTNCLGPFLLTHLLQDILRKTARNPNTKLDSVRTVWTSSFIHSARPGGAIFFDDKGRVNSLDDAMENYLQSKTGSVFLAHEWGLRLGTDRIVNMVSSSSAMNTVYLRGPFADLRVECQPGPHED